MSLPSRRQRRVAAGRRHAEDRWANPGPPLRPARRPQPWMAPTVVVLAAVVAVLILTRPHNGAGTPPAASVTGSSPAIGSGAGATSGSRTTSGAGTTSGARSSASASGGSTPKPAGAPQWLPVGVTGATTVGLKADPDGTLWLVADTATGPRLVHASTAGVLGSWTVPAAPPVSLQTVGAPEVWLSAAGGAKELGFDKAKASFSPVAAAPAVAAATASGYSVGLYVPRDAGGSVNGAPYVLVAPLGATSAKMVALPGASADAGAARGTVFAGPAGTALVVAGDRVWSVAVATGSARSEPDLPTDAVPTSAVWGAGMLWFVAVPPSGPPQILGLAAGSPSPSLLAASAQNPPVAGSPLCYTGGRLWWTGANAVLSESPAGGPVAAHAYPPGFSAGGLLTPGAGGAVWAAAGDRFALLR